jgi:hypothetical protein
MSVTVVAPATRALEAVLAELESAGIDATRDVGAFYPQPVGVLVGLPALIRRHLAARTYELSVLIVSGDPLNSTPAVDRVYALADDVCLALAIDSYAPSSWRKGPNSEPLPAVELTATVTVTETDTELEREG